MVYAIQNDFHFMEYRQDFTRYINIGSGGTTVAINQKVFMNISKLTIIVVVVLLLVGLVIDRLL